MAKDNLQYITGSITDEELVTRLKNRDQQAVSILYDKYSSVLYGVLVRIVHSEETAEDLVQEVFVKIWNNISSYDSSKGKLVTWIVNIARNMGIDKIRSKDYKDSARNSDIENYVNILEDGQNSSFNPDFIGVKEMLNILKPEQRQIVDLVYFQGYKQNEAADELKIPLGTLKTRLRTAISALREHFNK